LETVQVGLPTDEDLLKINERLLTKVPLPKNIDCNEVKLSYGCYTNKKRNQITEACLLKFISSNCPLFDSSMEPLNSAIIIKGIVTKQNRDVGPDFHKLLWALCGDDNLIVRGHLAEWTHV